MKYRFRFQKSDLIVALLCCGFLVACLGAIGAGGKRRVKEAICATNLKRWGMVWKCFVDDHDGYFPENLDWLGALEPYYDIRRLRLCPEATEVMSEPIAGYSQRGGKFSAWLVWDLQGNPVVCSYGLNAWVTRATGGGRQFEQLWKTPYTAGGTFAPLMTDCACDSGTPLTMDQPPEYDGQIYYSAPTDINEMRSFCLNRHTAAINVVFLDFSVRKVGLKHLWVQWWYRGWPDDLAEVGLPEWPEWMADFKNP